MNASFLFLVWVTKRLVVCFSEEGNSGRRADVQGSGGNDNKLDM